MHHNGTAPQLTLKHDDEIAEPELGLENWLFQFLFIQSNESFTKSVSMTDAKPLEMTVMHQSAQLGQLFQTLVHLYQVAWFAYEQSRRLQRVVCPFLSPQTWNEATEVARHGGCALPTEMGEATILCLDIADFTKLTDSHPLDQVLVDLNAYLDTLTQVVYRHRGDVNKYLGDGFLAVFADADDAVRAGCALQRAADDFNSCQSAQGRLVFPTRIGIDTGQVALTSLGSHDRQDRTVIGMPVNLAGRLQEQAHPGQVRLSQATFERLQNQSACRRLGPVQIKGRREPVVVYEKR